tara:strand:- start:255 stop:1226 length:972 start_codon:yes stop_codon:yes gene_type:complete
MKTSLSKKHDFDITVAANTYAGELSLPYVTAALLGAETIAKGRCRLLEGIVDKAVISGLSTTDTLQAANCAFAAGEDVTLTEQVLTQNDLAVMEEVCRKTMFPTWIAANGRMQRNGDLPVDWTDFLLGAVAERTGTSIENALWQGITTTFPFGFLANDGTITDAQIKLSACKDFPRHTTIAAYTAGTILAEMDAVFALASNTPGILGKPGCGFYVSYEAYAFFLQAMATQNTGPGYNQSFEGANYLGYPVYATSGIPNAVDVMVFTYPENLVVGVNSYTPDTSASLIPTYLYDGSDNVRISMRFAIGVQVGVAGDGVVGFAFE